MPAYASPDNRFRDAIAEILGFFEARSVDQGQHRQGVDSFGSNLWHAALLYFVFKGEAWRGRAVEITVALQSFQIGAHFGRTLVAQFSVFLQRLVDDPPTPTAIRN